MKCLKLLFSLLFFSLSLQLYSLSSEEKAALPDLSKQQLVEIVLIYDQTLTEIEQETMIQEQLLKQRETDLTERQKVYEKAKERLAVSEAALIVRESLLVESYEIQKRMNQAKFWNGFLFGNISGLVVGSVSGGLIVNKFK